MTDAWSERAELYRQSPVHREGPDLDLMVDWSRGFGTALDVATGGGPVARRLREAGLTVVTCDPAPGMEPDVIAPAEELPFADASFDVVTCRRAAHHFSDVGAAVREMARVSRSLVLLQDAVRTDERFEEAERLRDPSHVQHYTEEEWRSFFAAAGLTVTDAVPFEELLDLAAWLARTGCEGATASRVRELLAPVTIGDDWTYSYLVFRTEKTV